MSFAFGSLGPRLRRGPIAWALGEHVEDNVPKRGILLIALIVLNAIGVCIGLYGLVFMRSAFEGALPGAIVSVLTILAFAKLISLAGIWYWNRTAAVVYFGASVLALSIWASYEVTEPLVGLIGKALFLVVVVTKWKHMSWKELRQEPTPQSA